MSDAMTTPSKPEASLRELHDYSGFGFGLDADTLTDLNKCIAWLRERRMRIHATDCTVHQPSAQCSCGLHYVLSTLGFVGNDVETALAQPAARQEAVKCDGDHPMNKSCGDPQCWHGEPETPAVIATPPASGEAGAWKPTTLAFTADEHGVRVSMSEADFNDLRRLAAVAPPTASGDAAEVVREMLQIAPTCENDWDEQLRDWARRLAAVAPASGDIDAMVNRFLGWPLPKDFSPDCGISFDGRQDDEWNKNKTWPIGTNLFTAVQAKAMFAHCVAAVAPAGMKCPHCPHCEDGSFTIPRNPAAPTPPATAGKE